jgi:hypothetical protein
VWVANFYMGVFGRIRLDIKRERIEIDEKAGDPPDHSVSRKTSL